LLERIRERGSISDAARSMGMGYRHAWELVDEMNRSSPRTLVEKGVGGKGGGGAWLTPVGEAAVAGFWELVDDFGKWLSAQDARLWRNGAADKRKSKGRTGK
jgi:molybdate transport system regulatory protein